MDIFPTLLALTSALSPADVEVDGVNLLPVLLEGKKLPGRKLFWSYERRENQGEKVVREGPWKLYIRGEEKHLFNLAEDLGEQNNLIAAYPEWVRTMEAAFAQWYEEVTAGVGWLA